MRTSQQDNWVPRMGGELASSPDPHCIRSKRPPRHRWQGRGLPRPDGLAVAGQRGVRVESTAGRSGGGALAPLGQPIFTVGFCS